MSSTPKIIIHLEGGLVQAVYTNTENVEIMVMDMDIEGADLEEIINYNDIDGNKAEAVIFMKEPQLEKEWIKEIFNNERIIDV